jgi:hypothetical protein
MEVREDVTIAEMGNYRWLTVGPTRQPDVSFILPVPSPPVTDGDLAKRLSDFIAQGVIGSYRFSTPSFMTRLETSCASRSPSNGGSEDVSDDRSDISKPSPAPQAR